MPDQQTTMAPETEVLEDELPSDVASPDVPWQVVVWNDPVNLMSYVAMVFRKVLGHPKAKAHKLMLQVHEVGKAVVAHGTREKCEADCSRLHAHGLWATMEKAGR